VVDLLAPRTHEEDFDRTDTVLLFSYRLYDGRMDHNFLYLWASTASAVRMVRICIAMPNGMRIPGTLCCPMSADSMVIFMSSLGIGMVAYRAARCHRGGSIAGGIIAHGDKSNNIGVIIFFAAASRARISNARVKTLSLFMALARPLVLLRRQISHHASRGLSLQAA